MGHEIILYIKSVQDKYLTIYLVGLLVRKRFLFCQQKLGTLIESASVGQMSIFSLTKAGHSYRLGLVGQIYIFSITKAGQPYRATPVGQISIL